MYKPIQINNDKKSVMEIMESFNLQHYCDTPLSSNNKVFFTEAVFTDGKKNIEPLLEIIDNIKNILNEEIKKQELNNNYEFDPKAYWRRSEFKYLEDKLKEIFGFRTVAIHPLIEKYISAEKIFESKELNAIVYNDNRFPIDALVTEKGFYDKTKSCVMEIWITLGLIKTLEKEEILAILLHEFGHSIDPALVDITYHEINILSKYLTDRKKSLSNNEKKLVKLTKNKIGAFVIPLTMSILSSIKSTAYSFSSIFDIFTSTDKAAEKKLKKIRKIVQQDKELFDRRNSIEAYADNFARMYGYGSYLAKAFMKLSKSQNNKIRSRIKKEKARQDAILSITTNMIKDIHKTDIHRIRQLIKEYKDDINNPDIPNKTKQQLRDDLSELEKVFNEYLNHFDDFQNRVNKIINEELDNIDNSTVTESTEEFIEKVEKIPLNNKEYEEIAKHFGKDNVCFFHKDTKGY